MEHINVTTTTTAAEIAAVCFTAAAVKDYYKDLTSAGVEAAAARELIRAAAAIVKDRAGLVRSDIDAARRWYKSGEKVSRAVFAGFVKSADFKRVFKNGFSGGFDKFVDTYFPIQYGPDLRPVKVARETIDGVVFFRYRFINTARPGAYSQILDGCLNNVKRARLVGEDPAARIIPARSK